MDDRHELGGSGYLIGDEVGGLFEGSLTFAEQCTAAGFRYVELDDSSGEEHGCAAEALLDDEALEDDGGESAAVARTHNTRCEICDEGGEIIPCDYCNLCFHAACLTPQPQVPDDEFASACALGVAGRRSGLDESGVSTHDPAAAAAAQRGRDEAVRREHNAIEAFRRSQVATTRGALCASRLHERT